MENLFHTIREKMQSFSRVEKKIAQYLLANPEKIIHMTVAQLAKEAGTSEGSIINFANVLGFQGFSALKLEMAQSLSNREQIFSRKKIQGDGPDTIMEHLSEEIILALQSTIRSLDTASMQRAAQLLLHKKRIEIYGVGSSSMIASDAYYRMMRQGLPAYAATDPHIASVSASFLDRDSVAIAISHTGRTMETMQFARIAKEHGATLIAITSYEDSPLTKLSDITLLSVSQEADEHKEAMVSRYGQLLILDSLLLYVSIFNMNRTRQNMKNMADILEEHRIQEG